MAIRKLHGLTMTDTPSTLEEQISEFQDMAEDYMSCGTFTEEFKKIMNQELAAFASETEKIVGHYIYDGDLTKDLKALKHRYGLMEGEK